MTVLPSLRVPVDYADAAPVVLVGRMTTCAARSRVRDLGERIGFCCTVTQAEAEGHAPGAMCHESCTKPA